MTQKLLSAARSALGFIPKDAMSLNGNVYQNLEQALSDFESQPSGWISVKDRLPEPFTDVLGWRGYRAHVVRCAGNYEGNGIGWTTSSNGLSFDIEKITHWMPLPPAPEAG